MSQTTKIEWVQNDDGSQGQTWNFLRGCSRVSEGCRNCYAERQAARFAQPGGPYHGLVQSTPKGPRWTGEIGFYEHILLEPLKRRTPTTYFVNSMSDLFHEDVKDEWIDKAFAVMALTPNHTYQVLTKRPERMLEYVAGLTYQHNGTQRDRSYEQKRSRLLQNADSFLGESERFALINNTSWQNWPLPNVHLGVSAEDQKTADERIPLLLQTPAAVRWVSAEPLLGPVDLIRWLDGKAPGYYWFGECPACGWLGSAGVADGGGAIADTGDYSEVICPACFQDGLGRGVPLEDAQGVDWLVVGGESGPQARPCDISWIRWIVEQCKDAGVPVFVKQLGTGRLEYGKVHVQPVGVANHQAGTWTYKDSKGGDPSEWPADLRVREMPEVKR